VKPADADRQEVIIQELLHLRQESRAGSTHRAGPLQLCRHLQLEDQQRLHRGVGNDSPSLTLLRLQNTKQLREGYKVRKKKKKSGKFQNAKKIFSLCEGDQDQF